MAKSLWTAALDAWEASCAHNFLLHLVHEAGFDCFDRDSVTFFLVLSDPYGRFSAAQHRPCRRIRIATVTPNAVRPLSVSSVSGLQSLHPRLRRHLEICFGTIQPKEWPESHEQQKRVGIMLAHRCRDAAGAIKAVLASDMG